MTDLPAIDCGDQQALPMALHNALSEWGFARLVNLEEGLGLDNALLAKLNEYSNAFFTGSDAIKQRCAYRSATENFGYQGMGQENLDPTAPADLKQTFTMRNVLHSPLAAERWPNAEFQALMEQAYARFLHAGHQLQRALAQALDQPQEFFADAHNGECVSLRLLHYPSVASAEPNQLGAGAHTDYGMLTLLLQDDVGGLQVLNKNTSEWLDVPADPSTLIINSGDLLERWTNGLYRSTLHRVQPNRANRARLSIAMFLDPDADTQVNVLESCTSADNPARFPGITAGEHIQQMLNASHKDRYTS